MATTTRAPFGLWLGLGLSLGLALLALLGAVLAGWLPWYAPLGAWLLANALILLATRPAPPRRLPSPRPGVRCRSAGAQVSATASGV
jgi:hypothetical protein